MKITLNGEEVQIEENTSISKLLTLRNVDTPDMVTVHINGTAQDRAAFDQTNLNDADEVEFFFFMGGGTI